MGNQVSTVRRKTSRQVFPKVKQQGRKNNEETHNEKKHKKTLKNFKYIYSYRRIHYIHETKTGFYKRE